MKYKLLTLILLLAALAGCQRGAPPVSQPSGNVIVSDRLSNQRVNAFAEDADGHIWIATSRGLNRYSVHEYHSFAVRTERSGPRRTAGSPA